MEQTGRGGGSGGGNPRNRGGRGKGGGRGLGGGGGGGGTAAGGGASVTGSGGGGGRSRTNNRGRGRGNHSITTTNTVRTVPGEVASNATPAIESSATNKGDTNKGGNSNNNDNVPGKTGGKNRSRGGGGGGGGKNRPGKGNSSNSNNNASATSTAVKATTGTDVINAAVTTTITAISTGNEASEIMQNQSQEEARKRLEHEEALERKRKEEEEKERLKLQQELQQQILKAQSTIQAFLEILQQRQTYRSVMTATALAEARKEFEESKKKLKTDLKKCTAFVKKIKTGTAWNDALVNDVVTLNLSRYVEEVAAAILESKPKLADLPVFLSLCRAMHCRYPDFMTNLLPAMWTVVLSKSDSPEIAKVRRIYCRFITELYCAGLISDSKQLLKCVVEAAGGKDGSYNVQDANILVAFSKAASPDVLGILPRSVAEAVELIKSQPEGTVGDAMAAAERVDQVMDEIKVISQNEAHIAMTEHCRGAYNTLANSLVQTHHKLQKLEKRCEQDRFLAGSLTESREKGLADARKLKESLFKTVEAMADVLACPMPRLPAEEETEEQHGPGVEIWTKNDESENFGPFDDEETRAFYCDIPDMLATVPPALLGLSAEEVEAKKQENLKKYGNLDEGNVEEVADVDLSPVLEEQMDADEVTSMGMETAETSDPGKDLEGKGGKDTPHYRLMALIEELAECHRREQVDELTERFCTNHGSSKNSRKRLRKTLFNVPHSRLDLLPFFSRMVSTLDRVWSDVALGLIEELEQQFHGQAKFKKNQNIELRMRTARYIGELTKFRVAPPIIFLRCMTRCLEDFTGNNVDVACCLLESCGRFLFRVKRTSGRVTDIMESMNRLSKAKNLDERLQSQIKAAILNVKPPAKGLRKRTKEYPPLEAYLRHLLMSRLSYTSASCLFVAKQIARMPWQNPAEQCGSLVCRLMLKAARRGRYKTVQAIAAVAATLRTQRLSGEATVRLVDAVLEELRWAIDNPNLRDQQRVVTYARLLGELYCASQVTADVILKQLYEFINLGHEIPDSLRNASKKLSGDGSPEGQENNKQQLQTIVTLTGVAQTIPEDEEMEGEELEAKPVRVEAEKPVPVSEHSRYDPRVQSWLDPPHSAFRVKLVCTLLEVVAKKITTRNHLSQMKDFLTAFQRYLFTKATLPLDVEFALLDTFDTLDSHWRRLLKNSKSLSKGEKDIGFPRFATWLEAHNASVRIEEAQSILENQQRAKLAAGLDESVKDAEGHSHNDETESASMLIDDEDDDDDGTFSQSMSDGDDMDDEEDSENNKLDEDRSTDEDDDGGETESEEVTENKDDEDEYGDEAHLRRLEEEAFERELRRVTMDALEKGKSASRKLVADYMPSGSQVIKKKPVSDSTEVPAPPTITVAGQAGITLQVLRKGTKGKVEAKELIVPADTQLALAATKQDDEAARERDVIKQRVLLYEAVSAEAGYTGGNVYLEQEKLQVIRNRPLSMADIDKNFGTSGGVLRTGDKAKPNAPKPITSTIGRGGRGGRMGGGRGSSSGRTLYGL